MSSPEERPAKARKGHINIATLGEFKRYPGVPKKEREGAQAKN